MGHLWSIVILSSHSLLSRLLWVNFGLLSSFLPTASCLDFCGSTLVYCHPFFPQPLVLTSVGHLWSIVILSSHSLLSRLLWVIFGLLSSFLPTASCLDFCGSTLVYCHPFFPQPLVLSSVGHLWSIVILSSHSLFSCLLLVIFGLLSSFLPTASCLDFCGSSLVYCHPFFPQPLVLTSVGHLWSIVILSSHSLFSCLLLVIFGLLSSFLPTASFLVFCWSSLVYCHPFFPQPLFLSSVGQLWSIVILSSHNLLS